MNYLYCVTYMWSPTIVIAPILVENTTKWRVPNISFVAWQIGGIPLTIDIPMFHIENERIFDITKTLTGL